MNFTLPNVPIVEMKAEIEAQLTLQRSIALELIKSDFINNGKNDTEYFPPEENELNPYTSPIKPSTSNANQPALEVQSVNPILQENSIDDAHYIVTILRHIIQLFVEKSITLKEVENLLHQYISKVMLQPPSGSPKFLIDQKVMGLRPPGESHQFCAFCTNLGLPKKNCPKCSLYPDDFRFFKVYDLIKTIVTIIEQQKSIKFCGYCKEAGKSKEVYMSHVEKLQGGLIICPTKLAFLGSA